MRFVIMLSTILICAAIRPEFVGPAKDIPNIVTGFLTILLLVDVMEFIKYMMAD